MVNNDSYIAAEDYQLNKMRAPMTFTKLDKYLQPKSWEGANIKLHITIYNLLKILFQ